MQTDYSDQSRHQWRHFSKSLRGGVSVITGGPWGSQST